MRRPVRSTYARKFNVGTSMIELLSAMVVVAVGLLGISNLQTKGLKTSQDSYFVSQATFYLDDMAERMRANHASGNSAAGNYDFIDTVKNYSDLTAAEQGRDCDGAAASCTPGEMAEYDVAQWLNNMTNGNRALPGAKAKIVWAGNTATVTIRWLAPYADTGNCDADAVIGGATQTYRCLSSVVQLP